MLETGSKSSCATWIRTIVSTYAIGSLLPDSNSSIGLRFCLRRMLQFFRMLNTDAESVDDITAASRKHMTMDSDSPICSILDRK